MAEEIELKLTTSAEVLPEVRAHPAVAAVARGRAKTTRMVSTYYDTPGRDLAAAGVALRLRRAGGRWLQTVKGAGNAAAGLHARAEFEWPLAAPRIDPEKLARTPWRELFARNGAYRRVFATDVERSEQPLAFADGTRATLCLDVGEIRAGKRRAPVSEIEVELQAGDPSRLFELASALAADLPVRVCHASKAERGYALATQEAPAPRRARETALAPDATPQAALAAIAADCIAQIETNAAGVLAATRDPEYLHQVRVGWRRTRSLLKLARLIVPAERIDPLEQQLRALGAALGPARDADVFALETLPKVAAQFRGDREIVRLRLRAAARRRRASKLAREALASPQFQRSLLALGAFFASLARSPADAATQALARDWIRPVLDVRHRKLRKRARHAHRVGAAERHRARIAAKKLRYAAEFFAPLFPGKRTHAYVAALSKLQSALGRLNDLEVAKTLVDELAPKDGVDPAAAHAGGVVRGWLAASLAPDLKRLRDAQRAFRKCTPYWET
ncbi:MAG TPA: CHAD domain-containing protein [Casimicrobiaceae bacterium]